jgi:hypothetical protein
MAASWVLEIKRLAHGVWLSVRPKNDVATAQINTGTPAPIDDLTVASPAQPIAGTSAKQPIAGTSANKHLYDYLSYYVALPHPPKYAVLINGPWGIGKTYIVEDLSAARRARGSTQYFSTAAGATMSRSRHYSNVNNRVGD